MFARIIQCRDKFPARKRGALARLFRQRQHASLSDLHHGSLRVDSNLRPHHHVVCKICGSITDVEEDEIGPHARQRLNGRGAFQVDAGPDGEEQERPADAFAG